MEERCRKSIRQHKGILKMLPVIIDDYLFTDLAGSVGLWANLSKKGEIFPKGFTSLKHFTVFNDYPENSCSSNA